MLVAIEITMILFCLFTTATLCLCTKEGRKLVFQRRK